MATFLQLCQSVCSQSGIADASDFSSTVGQSGIFADIVRWVNEAYNEIQYHKPNWNFLYSSTSFTLSDTEDEYTPTGFRSFIPTRFIIEPSGGTKSFLEYIEYDDWKNSSTFLQSNSEQPYYVTITPDNKLKFYPTANASYTIFYDGYLVPDTFTGDADTPIFRDEYHDLIQFKALIKYAAHYNSPEIYQDNTANYDLGIKKMVSNETPSINLDTYSLT